MNARLRTERLGTRYFVSGKTRSVDYFPKLLSIITLSVLTLHRLGAYYGPFRFST